MTREESFQHSILAVSCEKTLIPLIRRSLQSACIMSIESVDNAAGARRRILERYYTMLVINSPLLDESGVELAIDAANQLNSSILLIVSGSVYMQTLERVTDYGILVIEKPLPVHRISHAVRFLTAHQTRIKELEQRVQSAEDKVQEIRLIDKAKFYLIERKHLTEDEAHRYIGKTAMNHGVSRKRAAQQILDEEDLPGVLL